MTGFFFFIWSILIIPNKVSMGYKIQAVNILHYQKQKIMKKTLISMYLKREITEV